MNSKRISFGFLVLAVYAMLGVVGVYTQSPTQATEVCATDIVSIVKAADVVGTSSASSGSSSGSSSANVEWHSFLPGAFK
jgi:hypothetical protein